MKTRIINFRTTEERYSQIKRASRALSLSMTEMLEHGLALFLSSDNARRKTVDPWDHAFEKLLKSKKISPLTASERAVVKSYEAEKAAGILRTIPAEEVLADIKAALEGAPQPRQAANKSAPLPGNKIRSARRSVAAI